MPTRRQILASTGIIAGGIATGIATTSTNAQTSIDVNGLSVADRSISSNTPLKEILLTVSGEYQYAATVTPDRVVIRLEAQTDSGYKQIDAMSVSDPTNEQTGSYSLEGDILRLSGFENILPDTRGDSKSETVTVRVRLEVSHNGGEIGTADAQDTTTITVKRTEASVEASIGGSGSIEITTEMPTG